MQDLYKEKHKAECLVLQRHIEYNNTVLSTGYLDAMSKLTEAIENYEDIKGRISKIENKRGEIRCTTQTN